MTTVGFQFKMTPDGRFTDVKEVRMTKLEQVARAIGEFDLDGASGIYEQQLMKAARAAVEALREPSQQAVEDAVLSYSLAEDGVREYWRFMLDAILSEKPE